jgi:hypothetical protein
MGKRRRERAVRADLDSQKGREIRNIRGTPEYKVISLSCWPSMMTSIAFPFAHLPYRGTFFFVFVHVLAVVSTVWSFAMSRSTIRP